MSRWLVGAAAMGLVACGVEYACTDMGCGGSLVVEVSGLADGAWDLALTTDGGEVAQCSFDLPGSGAAVCSGDLTVALADGDGVVVVTIETRMTDGAPFTSLGLTATDSEGGELGADVTPVWDDPVYPNGEECDAPIGCSSAEATVTLMPPPADG
jgi:hypothetical protein